MSTTLHCVSEGHNTHAIINCLQLLTHAATPSIQPLTHCVCLKHAVKLNLRECLYVLKCFPPFTPWTADLINYDP